MVCSALGLLGGILSGLSFDPGRGALILAGFVPLFAALARASGLSGALAGLVFAAAYFGLVFRWLAFYGWLPVLALVAVVFLPVWAVIGGLTAGLGRNIPERTIILGSGFLIVEQVFRQMGYSGVPWAHSAHALTPPLSVQGEWLVGAVPPLLLSQMSPVLGVNGVGVAIVACNAGIALAILGKGRNRAYASAIAGIILLFALVPAGASRPPLEVPGGVEVAAVQTGVPTTTDWTPQLKAEVLKQYEEQVRKAQAEGARFIVLPESFIQDVDYAGSGIQYAISRDWLTRGNAAFYGAGFVKTYGDFPERVYPAFVVVDKRGFRGAILKHQLVPVGEFVIWRKYLTAWFPRYPWTPYDSRPAGSISPVRIKGYSVGGLICYETLYPELARRLSLSGADFLISGTNSSWMGNTRATEQMVRFEMFRALETGKYFIRAGTAGISSFIAPDGQVKKALPQFVTGFVRGRVEPRRSLTFYVRHGDLLPWLLWSLTIIGVFGVWLGNGGRDSAGS